MAGRILVKTLDGQWETLGTDREPGSGEPYGILPTYNEWGPDTLAFNIRRDPAVEHVDLDAYTPIRYYPDGGDRVTWAGFLLERPGSNEADPSIAGQARGWQYHLDDDVKPAMYVHNDLSVWQDFRTHPDVNLAQWPAGLICNNADGQIILGWANGQGPITQFTGAGVYFDFGPDSSCWPSVCSVDLVYPTAGLGAGPSTAILLRCADSPAFFAAGTVGQDVSDYFSGTSVAAGVVTGATSTPRRYVGCFVWRQGVTAASPTADAVIGFQGIRCYRNNGLLTGVPVSYIIKDYLPVAPLLNQSTEDVADTSLLLPHAAWPAEPMTPREVLSAWNAYHRYVLKIGGPNLDRLVFKPQPARAVLRVDSSKPGARFADASISSGADVYNRVLVRARNGSGEPLAVERTAGALPTAQSLPAANLQAVNPSADTAATGWSSVPAAAVTIARDTAVFFSSPASIKASSAGIAVSQGLSGTLGAGGGTFKAGVTYIVTFQLRVTYPGVAVPFIATFGSPGLDDNGGVYITAPPTNTFAAYAVSWTPKVDAANVILSIVRTNPKARILVAAPTAINIDDVAVTVAIANVIDRRGFRRTFLLEVGSPSDIVALGALGDAFLSLHRTTPLKGSLEISDDSAVRELATGRPVPTSELGLYIGELVHLANLSDPDVPGGTMGRNGKVAGAGGVDDVTLTIDNQRNAFDALLARMAVVQTPRV